ncbi:hypothetical protein J4455_00330 [Candidatus Woesearchaeota archaeon]|nr:hypothetical protein [Candidatus Woesearchaeota archaeon]
MLLYPGSYCTQNCDDLFSSRYDPNAHNSHIAQYLITLYQELIAKRI